MSQGSPTKLNTPRNRALAVGVQPFKLAEPNMSGSQCIPPAPPVADPVKVSPARGEAFVVRGGG